MIFLNGNFQLILYAAFTNPGCTESECKRGFQAEADATEVVFRGVVGKASGGLHFQPRKLLNLLC